MANIYALLAFSNYIQAQQLESLRRQSHHQISFPKPQKEILNFPKPRHAPHFYPIYTFDRARAQNTPHSRGFIHPPSEKSLQHPAIASLCHKIRELDQAILQVERKAHQATIMVINFLV